MRSLSRSGLDGSRSRSRHCRAIAELSGAANVRHAGRRTPRRVGGSDETGCSETHRRRSRRYQRIRRIACLEETVGKSDSGLGRMWLEPAVKVLRTALAWTAAIIVHED